MSNSVIILEDDLVLREHLQMTINAIKDFSVIAVADSVADGASLLEIEPDIALIDLNLVDGSGVDLIQAAKESNGTKVIVITVLADERSVLQAFDAGADGFLLKDGDEKSIGTALNDVLSGGSPISAAAASHLLRRVRRPVNRSSDFKLTPRELEMLGLLAKGLSIADVGECMGISPLTVSSHTKAIYRKMSVHSRSEAVFEAISEGLIRIGG